MKDCWKNQSNTKESMQIQTETENIAQIAIERRWYRFKQLESNDI